MDERRVYSFRNHSIYYAIEDKEISPLPSYHQYAPNHLLNGQLSERDVCDTVLLSQINDHTVMIVTQSVTPKPAI